MAIGTDLLVLVSHPVLANLLAVMSGTIGRRGNTDGGEKSRENRLDLGSVCLM